MAAEISTDRTIFLEAVESVPKDRWEAFIKDRCADDVDLYNRVERLLRAHSDLGDFQDHKPSAAKMATVDTPPIERLGTQIGPYKIREQIGEGGMGVVYVAEQTKPVRRKVALKIIKPGMDSKDIIARFESERQALAMMDHPNIAKVLDAGATKSGRPYFVMELVHGIPITDFSDDKRLSTRQRLQLFVDVCRAVQHAHQKGIIHRDLKPSNIMVTMHDDESVPKVIDFGIAKALSQKLTDDTVYTAYGQMVGTPLYMSPEQTQISGLDVDTRSDVYSLGVLLYELLTGTTPFEKETLKNAEFDEMRRMIREDDPPRPSARISTLDARLLSTVSARRAIDPRKLGPLCGDELDWIVMKALEKDRTRRYETANDFAADIHRYLNDEPAEACPPSAAYRFRKFARRNKAPLATLSLVAAALVIGMLGTTWQAVRANGQRDRALAAEQQSRDDQHAAEVAKTRAEENANRLARQLAAEYLGDAQNWCVQGHIDTGMLWMARSLQIVPKDDPSLQRCIRANLAAWSARLHTLKAVLQHQGTVTAVAYSPDGARILTGSEDRTARLWNMDTGEPIGKTFNHASAISTLSFSSDGSQVLTGSTQGTSRRWDVTTGKPIGQPIQHDGKIRSVSHHRGAMRVLVQTADDVLRINDATTGQQIGALLEHPSQILAAVFSPDGSQILTGSEDKTTRLWNAITGQPIGEPFLEDNEVAAPSKVTAVTFSPDGSQVLAAAEASWVRFWDANTREPIRWVLIAGVAHDMVLSPDNSRLLTGLSGATLQDVTAPFHKLGQNLPHQDRVLAVAYATDGASVVTGSRDETARVWELAIRPTALKSLPLEDAKFSRAVALSPDGSQILRAMGPIARIWDVASGKSVGRPLEHKETIWSVAFSHDGSRILTGCEDGTARLWDAATHETIGEPLKHQARVSDVAFSPDGKHILTASDDMTAQRWDVATLQPLGQPLQHDGGLYEAKFSPDGSRILTAPWDNPARLWNAATGSLIAEFIGEGEVTTVAFSPDGNRIVTGSNARTARLWDGFTGVSIGKPLWHQDMGPIFGVTFSPDGAYILTANGKAQLWDAATGQPIGPPMENKEPIRHVAFSPDGSFILTHGPIGDTLLWKPPPAPIDGLVERIVLWTQVVTGMDLDLDSGETRALSGPIWHGRLRQLQQLGGAPLQLKNK